MAGSVSVESQRFAVTVVAIGPGKLLVPVPFNPDRSGAPNSGTTLPGPLTASA